MRTDGMMKSRAIGILSTILVLLCLPVSEACSQWVQTSVPDSVGVPCLATIGPNLFAGTYQAGVYLSTDNGFTWLPRNNPFIPVATLATLGSDIFLGANGGTFRSTNNGVTWDSATSGYHIVNHLAVSKGKIFAAYEALDGVFTSADSGKTWDNGFIGLPLYKSWYTWVSAFAVSSTDIFATTAHGVSKWIDSTSMWTFADFGISARLSGLFASGKYLLAGSDSGIIISTDNGRSWQAGGNGLPPNPTVNAFESVGGQLFLGTSRNGLFLSTDQGATWMSESLGLTDSTILSIAARGDQLIVGTSRCGVWRRRLSEMSGQNGVAQPKSFELAIALYPNPFTHSTIISFQSDGGQTEVAIVNTLGIQVARLFDGELAPGEHSFGWDAHGMPQGSYICVLRQQGRGQYTGAMILK